MTLKYGIDFGTTNSSIAFRFTEEDDTEHTIVVDLKDRYPKETIPSTVCICEDGSIFVGMDAFSQASKRKAANKKVRIIKKMKIDLEAEESDHTYTVGNRVFNGVDLVAAILAYLRKKADQEIAALGLKASGVVMGVPVQYGDMQKDMLKDALVKAGYYQSEKEAEGLTEFVSEPVAVAVHYGLNTTDNKTIMVFDFGGGTLDLAVVNLKNQVGIDHLHPHEVISKERLTLGGEELTKLFFTKAFCGNDGYGVRKISRAFHLDKQLTPDELWDWLSQNNIGVEFLDEVEQCKCELSTSKYYKFSFFGSGGITLNSKMIDRDSFAAAISEKLQEIDDIINSCLEKGGIDDPYKIDNVIIAGGSSLIPCVQELLISRFGKKKVLTSPGAFCQNGRNTHRYNSESEVLTSIVRGLAAIGCRKESLVEDVVDNDYGIWIDRDNSFLPIIKSGTLVKDAAMFDKLSCEGKSIDVETEYEDQTTVTIKIFQHNLNGYNQLGTVFIEDVGGMKYKIFMHIDSRQGKLVVDMYDIIKKHWYKIPLNQSQYDIQNGKGD